MTRPQPSAPLLRRVVWRRILDDQAFDIATLWQGDGGYRLAGTIVAAHEGAPLRAEYVIDVDAAWRTRHVVIEQDFAAGQRRLELAVTVDAEEPAWRVDGAPAPALAGCVDVDLEFTPATNALPINRFALAEGQAAFARAAWVRFPGLTVEPAEQRYTRVGPARYRYEGLGSDFTAIVDVDDVGLPTLYQGIWQRVGDAAGAADG